VCRGLRWAFHYWRLPGVDSTTHTAHKLSGWSNEHDLALSVLSRALPHPAFALLPCAGTSPPPAPRLFMRATSIRYSSSATPLALRRGRHLAALQRCQQRRARGPIRAAATTGSPSSPSSTPAMAAALSQAPSGDSSSFADPAVAAVRHSHFGEGEHCPHAAAQQHSWMSQPAASRALTQRGPAFFMPALCPPLALFLRGCCQSSMSTSTPRLLTAGLRWDECFTAPHASGGASSSSSSLECVCAEQTTA
jgi:hypothetical protein